jgi:hypothetical protein
MAKLLLLLAIAIIAGNWWRRRATSRVSALTSPDARTPDERTLAALAEAGSDLSKPTEVNFYLYLPTEGHARSAADVAQNEGYSAEVRPPLEGYTTWLCLLSRVMIPRRADLEGARRRLEALAESLGGEFDGWEAAVAD